MMTGTQLPIDRRRWMMKTRLTVCRRMIGMEWTMP